MSLPPRHSFSDGMLTRSNANASSDNGKTYQCILVTEELFSNTATLTVTQGQLGPGNYYLFLSRIVLTKSGRERGKEVVCII